MHHLLYYGIIYIVWILDFLYALYSYFSPLGMVLASYLRQNPVDGALLVGCYYVLYENMTVKPICHSSLYLINVRLLLGAHL